MGKGITSSSIALLLKSAGYKVAPIKADPYLNLDAGTMNPVVHGETFVTDDGTETDQDLGHYERFLNESLTKLNYMTLGQVFQTVIQRERNLEYKGSCVEAAVHLPEEIIRRLKNLAKATSADFVILEIGGTAGEFQNAIFHEAARQLKLQMPKDILNIHVAYLPMPPSLGELKSKPVQTSVHLLNEVGVQPDIIIGRAEKEIDDIRKEKISIFCNVRKEDVFSNPDVSSVYFIPELFKQQKLTESILSKLNLKQKNKDLKEWKKFTSKINEAKNEVKIAIVGKYFRSGEFSLEDSYVCVLEAIKQASWWNKRKPVITWIDSLDVEKKGGEVLRGYDGVIVPQGWGSRGLEGKIMTAKFCRENKIPYLGLCFGMQMAVIEFARNVCGLKDAHTGEAGINTKNEVIHIMSNQVEYLEKHQYGGTIRLGAWPCKLLKGTKIAEIYSKHKALPANNIVSERHRHRYEFNNKYREEMEKKGLIISGVSPDGELVEAIELSDHPFFIGTQFHPEFKSRPLSPHPIFMEFIRASSKINS